MVIFSFIFGLTVSIYALLRIVRESKGIFNTDKTKYHFALVSASSVNKKDKEADVYLLGKGIIDTNNQEIKEEDYNFFPVDGKSMKRFGIDDGEVVLIPKTQKMEDVKRELLTSVDAFVVLNSPQEMQGIKYKLRKFVDFYDTSDGHFDQWIAQKHSGLKGKYDKKKAQEELGKCQTKNCQLLVSETRRPIKLKLFKNRIEIPLGIRVRHCSLHSEDAIEGKVKYRIPKDRVQILNKY